MSGRLNGKTIKRMREARDYKYGRMETTHRAYRKPTLGPRQMVIKMVKDGKSLSEIRKAFPGCDDKMIRTWIEEELPAEEVEKLIKADIVEDIVEKTIKERIQKYIDRGLEKEKIPAYLSNSKILLEYTNCKTREDLEAYIKRIMDREEQNKCEER